MNQVSIYGLIDPRNGQIKYIGQSVNPTLRWLSHCSGGKGSEGKVKASWLGELLDLGLRPELLILETVTPELGNETEVFYIQYFKMLGANLTNIRHFRKPEKRPVTDPPVSYKTLGIRLTQDLYEKIFNMAIKDRRSVNGEIAWLLKELLQENNGQAA